MDKEEEDRWPLWAEPATKGDLVTAMVATRACVVDIFVCLSALNRGDMARFKEVLADLSKSDDELQDTMDEIGGRQKSE